MMDIFTAVYFIAIVIETVIRAPLNKKRKQEKMSEQRFTRQEKTLLGLLILGMMVVPIVYAATNWLDFADYTLPVWAGWLGVVLIGSAIFVFWHAHVDLGLNWSPTLEIREKHELITSGIYGQIRHPMYASQWLWVICPAISSAKLDRRLHQFAGFHPLLYPARSGGGAINAGTIR